MADNRTDFTKSGVSRFPDRNLGVPWLDCEVGVPLADQKKLRHNRWHSDIPPLSECDPGDEVILETPGYDDYQLLDQDNGDIHTIDLIRTHPVAGPVRVRGAEPGDLPNDAQD